MNDLAAETAGKHRYAPTWPAAYSAGETIGAGEEAAIRLGTSRVCRFRSRHPILYGVAAFIIGGGLMSVFTMTTYANWAYQSIDLVTVFYQVLLGGIGAGIVCVILAFAYTATISKTLEPMREDGVIGDAGATGELARPTQ